MLNTFEIDTIREVRALVLAKQPVPQWQKQMLLDLLKREGLGLTPYAIANALKQGFDVQGIKTR